MISLNKTFLIGRLGQDPQTHYTATGQAVVNFSLATDESYTDQSGQKVEQTEWHRIVVFGKLAEVCANYLGKGRLVFVEGRLRTRKWKDRQGQDRYTTEIVAKRVQNLERKQQQQGGPVPGQQPDTGLGPAFPENMPEDDAPF